MAAETLNTASDSTLAPAFERRRILSSRTRLRLLPVIDLLLAPFAALSAKILLLARTLTLNDLPRSRRAILRAGIYPLIDHYYEPLFDFSRLRLSQDDVRHLPGVRLDLDRATEFLRSLTDTSSLTALVGAGGVPGYRLDNSSFPAGDAEVLFGLLRKVKPRRVVEIGCGNSTLIIRAALRLNEAEGVTAEHVCIEPFEQPWLEKLGILVVRKPVEMCDNSLFTDLQAGDVLFVDSSHMIRPQGDVLHEVLGLFGLLASGVLIHVHDIFTPREYPDYLLREHHVFWNEQYLLEAFLAFNSSFRVLLPMNCLWHERTDVVRTACPGLATVPSRRPASFWLTREC